MKYSVLLIPLLFCATLYGQQKDSLLFEKGAFSIYKDKAVFLDRILYHVKADYKRILEVEEDGNTDCVGNTEIIYKPLSLLGDFYSFEKLRFDSGGGGDCYRNPSNEIQVQTIHIKTLNKVNLLNLVEEESVVTALKKDTWIRNMTGAENTNQLNTKNTFEEILDFINQRIGDTFHTDSFALYSYNKKPKRWLLD